MSNNNYPPLNSVTKCEKCKLKFSLDDENSQKHPGYEYVEEDNLITWSEEKMKQFRIFKRPYMLRRCPRCKFDWPENAEIEQLTTQPNKNFSNIETKYIDNDIPL